MTLDEIREMIDYCGIMMNRISTKVKTRVLTGAEISEETSYYQRQCKYKSMLPLV
jgi:hypothetical protein